ncbi:MAG: acyloxyacyl hydrolase, partial [Bacteroidetes bacterium]|nr:acyloxyacyl hydrolase [Bacteroidota bacterium]
SKDQYEHKLFTSNIIIEAKIHYGFLYAQHLELELFNAHFPAFEFSIEKLTYGRQRWERAFNYPIIGMTFFYSPLGSNPILGSSLALMPFVNFPLFKSKAFTFGFRFALGLGYLTKKFDRINNYKDIAIGSHLNAAINLMLEARYQLSEYFTLTAGVCLQHFSNGSLNQVSRKSKFGMGFDLSYDASHKKILETAGITTTSPISITRPGVNAAYELMLGKLGFIMNLGVYLSGKEKSNGPLYEKLCFQYNFTKNFFAHVLLKVHFGRADYIGWGFGYNFNVLYGKKTIK